MPGSATTTTPSATTAPKTTAKPYLTTTPTLQLSDRTTKPGTKLRFGQQAVVPFYSYYDKGLLAVTVTVDSAPAPDADIDSLPLKDEDKAALRGKTFFFVRQHLVNLDGTNLAEIWAPTLEASTRSGGWPGTLLGVGDNSVTGCDDPSTAPSDFATPGATFDTCTLFFGTASDPIISLAYTEKPYEQAATRAVTWRR